MLGMINDEYEYGFSRGMWDGGGGNSGGDGDDGCPASNRRTLRLVDAGRRAGTADLLCTSAN